MGEGCWRVRRGGEVSSDASSFFAFVSLFFFSSLLPPSFLPSFLPKRTLKKAALPLLSKDVPLLSTLSRSSRPFLPKQPRINQTPTPKAPSSRSDAGRTNPSLGLFFFRRTRKGVEWSGWDSWGGKGERSVFGCGSGIEETCSLRAVDTKVRKQLRDRSAIQFVFVSILILSSQ